VKVRLRCEKTFKTEVKWWGPRHAWGVMYVINALKLILKIFCVAAVMCLGELRAGNCFVGNRVTTSN
jgi:hypothetical protein